MVAVSRCFLWPGSFLQAMAKVSQLLATRVANGQGTQRSNGIVFRVHAGDGINSKTIAFVLGLLLPNENHMFHGSGLDHQPELMVSPKNGSCSRSADIFETEECSRVAL